MIDFPILGLIEATFLLGTYYQNGYHNTSQIPDYQKAVECFKKAAVAGLAVAQHNLGVLYFEGKFVEKDIPTAIEYWNMASQQKMIVSMINLARVYAQGTEDGLVEPDAALARKHLKDAQSVLDSPEAQIDDPKIEQVKQKVQEMLDDLGPETNDLVTAKDKGRCNIM
jgi:uncharacterized protein